MHQLSEGNMRAEHKGDLRFALRRSINLGDLRKFRDFLSNKGHDVALLRKCEGGIDFSPKRIGGKDLRWGGFSCIGVDATGKSFVNNESTIVSEHVLGLEEWHCDNNIRIRLKQLGVEKFSADEVYDIRVGMVACLGVTDNVIYNRTEKRFVVLPDDKSRDVNMFLEYNLQLEIERWTIALPQLPQITEERLFQCWHCKEDRPAFVFDVDDEAVSNHDSSFYRVLECFVNSTAPCCSDCAYKLTRCDTPVPRNVLPPPKRRKT